MTQRPNSELDLTLSRVIKAPRPVVWSAWADRAGFEQWWVPAPARCKVVAMELRPSGSFETLISEDGGDFAPHLSACFLDIVAGERIVFTDALRGGWRPAENPFVTASITLRDHPEGPEYIAHVMHKYYADRSMHETIGFFDGWGAVVEQLANLVEQRAASRGATVP
jgi:uncharacterized protein YndB with AHSA1/START domain